MTEKEKALSTFTTRVRQMILLLEDMKKQRADLLAQIDELKAQKAQVEKSLNQARSDYESLKMAKMMQITDGDLDSAKKRVAKLIREVDKCITLVSEK